MAGMKVRYHTSMLLKEAQEYWTQGKLLISPQEHAHLVKRLDSEIQTSRSEQAQVSNRLNMMVDNMNQATPEMDLLRFKIDLFANRIAQYETMHNALLDETAAVT